MSWDCAAATCRDISGRPAPREDPLSPRTGELIVARGIATAELVETAQRESRARGEPICSRLLSLGVDEGELAVVLAEKHGVPAVDLSRSAVALDLLELVPRAVAEGDLILPLSREGGRIHLAMSRPADERVVAEIRFVTGREVSAYVCVRGSLLRAVAEAYEARARGVTLWRGRCCAAGAPHLAAVLPAPSGEAVPPEEVVPDADIIIEVEPDVEPEPRPPAARDGGAPLVLVVDDEREIRQLVQRTLQAKGFQVEVAGDGEEALEKSERLVPDLVLLDAMLPKVHGFEACRRMKASPRTRDVPVIMMTAIYRGWRFAQDARDSYGAEDYVEKPFRLDDLLRRVEAALHSGGRTGETALEQAHAHEPHVAHGRELLAAGRIPEAVSAFAQAIRANPSAADAHLHHGRALRASGDLFAAMTSLEHAVEVAPGHLPALRALAAVYEETGFRRRAAGMLERALAAARDETSRAAIRGDIFRLIA